MNESDLKPVLQKDEDGNKSGIFKRAMLMAGLTCLFYIAGVIAYGPLLDQYVRQTVAKQYNHSHTSTGSVCTRNLSDENIVVGIKIQQRSAEYMLYLSIVSGVLTTVVNLVIGSYSDFLGRRFGFMVPVVGGCLKSVVLCFITGLELSLNWLYLAYAVDGLTGGAGGYFMALFSYTADVTEPGRRRTIVIACLEGVMAIAASLGSLAVGFVIQRVGYTIASIMVTVTFGLGVLVILFLLPETIKQRTERELSPIKHAKVVLGFFISGTKKHRLLYTIALLIFFFSYLSNGGRRPVEVLYQLDRPFCWSPEKIGYYGALRNTVGILCSVVLLKLLQPCLQDMTIAMIGVVFGMGSLTLEGLAVNDWMMYLVPIVNFTSFNLIPVCRAVMSQMTPPHKQGALFASIASMESLCTLISSVIYSAVYRGTVARYRGAVFLLMAGEGIFTAVSTLFFMHLTRDGVPMHDETLKQADIDTAQEDDTNKAETQRSQKNNTLQNIVTFNSSLDLKDEAY